MPNAPPDTTVQSRSASPYAMSAVTWTPYPVAARAPDHRDRPLQRLAQRPRPAHPEAERRPDVQVDPAGRVQLQGGQRVHPRRPLVVGGHHDAGAEPFGPAQRGLGHPARVTGRRPGGTAARNGASGMSPPAAGPAWPARRAPAPATRPPGCPARPARSAPPGRPDPHRLPGPAPPRPDAAGSAPRVLRCRVPGCRVPGRWALALRAAGLPVGCWSVSGVHRPRPCVAGMASSTSDRPGRSRPSRSAMVQARRKHPVEAAGRQRPPVERRAQDGGVRRRQPPRRPAQLRGRAPRR